MKEKQLASGSYRVAVATDNTLDIFPADAVPSPGQPASAAAPAGAAPAAVPTLAAPQSTGPSAGLPLPQGFSLFDPISALPNAADAVNQRLPATFDLFAGRSE